MGTMETGKILIHLSSPFIPGHRLTGDGLLSGVLFSQTGDGPAAAECPMLARAGSVFCASQAMFVAPVTPKSDRVNRSFMSEQVRDPSMAELVNSTLPNSYWSVGAGEYQNITSEYTAFDVATIVFFVRGDLDAINRLLNKPTIPAIGSARHKGRGQVAKIEVRRVKSNNPYFGIVGDGMLLRPVPLDEMEPFRDMRHIIGKETVRPPYRWSHTAVRCGLPPFTVQGLDNATLARIGV